MSVQIAVSDPLPVYRRGIMASLQDGGFGADAPDDLIAWINGVQRKVVVLTLHSAADWDLLLEVHRTRSDVLIVAAVQDTSPPTYVRALMAGAVGVVPRDAHPAVIRKTIEAAIQGDSVLPIEVLRILTARDMVNGPTDETPSSREIDWLRQLADGVTVGRLAARAGYSERMMFRLLRDLYGRLEVRSRTEALMLARERGWV